MDISDDCESSISRPPSDLRARTRRFALDVIVMVEKLPRGRTSDVIGRQLLRCATSVGANYRAHCCGRSTAEFIAKLGIVQEEADEAIYWLELLVEAKLLSQGQAKLLIREADELLSITIASIKTARKRSS